MKDGQHNIKMTAEKVVKKLHYNGIDISMEDALKVLLLLKKIARIVVSKYLEK